MINEKHTNHPAFLLCPPYSLSANIPNNPWMEDMTAAERKIDMRKAINQWKELYHSLASHAMVYLLPPTAGLQDQVYVSNLAFSIPDGSNRVIMSKFKSPPRVREPDAAIPFFNSLGFERHTPPMTFEGEADLKYLGGNKYIGGYGIRSTEESYDWMIREFDMDIVKVRMKNDLLYHLDCSLCPLPNGKTIVSISDFMVKDIKKIEKVTEIIAVDTELAYYGITSNIICGPILYSHSNLHSLKRNDEEYYEERRKVETLEDICAEAGYEPHFINISEFFKSGALMSCLAMHLNFIDFR